MPDPLEGIRVLDFGRFIAGPFCAALLADLGADVIRVEKVRGGEDRFLMPVTPAGDGAFYLQVNRGKRGMTLNPRAAEGRHVLQRLVATADVVVANLPDAALKALGLDYDALTAVKPDVILTSVSAFGAGGPSSHRLGFDGIGQAMSGIMYLSGRPGEPTKAYCPYVDFTTALVATVGTLAALLVRRDTGQGQHVRASLLASALTIANGMLMEQGMIRPDRVATGNRSQTQGPSDAFRTRDGWVLVQCIGQPLFQRWTDLMGEPHWLDDPRFSDDSSRGDHGAVISERMAAVVRGSGRRTRRSRPSTPRASRPGRCFRRSRCSTTRTCGPSVSCGRSRLPAPAGRRRWRRRRSRCRRRPPVFVAGPRRSASITTRSWRSSATRRPRSRPCTTAGSSDRQPAPCRRTSGGPADVGRHAERGRSPVALLHGNGVGRAAAPARHYTSAR